MEARIKWLRPLRRWIGILTVIVVALSSSISVAQQFVRVPAPRAQGIQQQYRAASRNFSVTAPDQQLANSVAHKAEQFRKELAIKWLGYELPDWEQRCPIKVQLAAHAGGETSFAFVSDHRNRFQSGYRSGGSGPTNFRRPGKPIDWRMKIFGPANRILDSVLPHEVTHTVFATHFGQPLPRWADEGACTTVEHETERAKNHQMLISFLMSRPSRGIPFNRMFTMKQYPHDILPLYAQGYSLSRFLIQQKGHQHFIEFIGAGLENSGRLPELRNWDQVTSQYYGYKDLSDLQIAWIKWVRGGSKQVVPQSGPAMAGNNPSRSDRSTLDEKRANAQLNQGLAGSWYATQVKSSAGLVEKNYSAPVRIRPGVEHKIVQPQSETEAFLPGSVGEQTLLRKPAANQPVRPQSERPAIESTSDRRHLSTANIWR